MNNYTYTIHVSGLPDGYTMDDESGLESILIETKATLACEALEHMFKGVEHEINLKHWVLGLVKLIEKRGYQSHPGLSTLSNMAYDVLGNDPTPKPKPEDTDTHPQQ